MPNSRSIISLFVFLLFVFQSYPKTKNNPDYKTKSFSISGYIFPDPEIQFKVRVSSPISSGKFPTLIFVPGFGALIPPSFYSLLLDRFTAKGYIVMGISRIQLINYQKIANQVGSSIKWLKQNLQTELIKQDLNGVVPDWDQLVLSAHSAGGHIISQRLNTTCSDNPKALILLDPVDGVDPFGLIQDYIVPDPPKTLPFHIPTLILASKKSQSGKFFLPACTDPKMSNKRFYNGLSGPTWYVQFLDYGHADLLNQPFDSFAKVMCKGCSECSGRDEYNQDLVNLMDTFIQGTLQKNADKINIIINPSGHIYSDNLYSQYNLHGFNPLSGGFCQINEQRNE